MNRPENTINGNHRVGQKWTEQSTDSEEDEVDTPVKKATPAAPVNPPPIPRRAAKRRAKKANAECWRCGLQGHFVEDCTSEPGISNSGTISSANQGSKRSPHLIKLGLRPDQDDPTLIKAAYRSLALATHPDKNPQTETTAKFQAILAAYNALCQE